jgi:N-acetylglucosamine-6-phosphate deacetylase
MSGGNDLVCFTNCLLALEDGSLVSRDLWIDSDFGLILDAQVREPTAIRCLCVVIIMNIKHTFFARQTRPSRVVDLNGAVLAPGLLDIQINGAFGVDFSIYNNNKGVPANSEGERAADRGYIESLIRVASSIVETGVTG